MSILKYIDNQKQKHFEFSVEKIILINKFYTLGFLKCSLSALSVNFVRVAICNFFLRQKKQLTGHLTFNNLTS